MTQKCCRYLISILVLTIAVLIVCLAITLLKCSAERVEVNAAWSLIADYDGTRRHLDTLSITFLVDHLEITAHAKFGVANQYLYKIMERERSKIVQDILLDLRKKTGEDLGSDPEKWIEKYGSSRKHDVAPITSAGRQN